MIKTMLIIMIVMWTIALVLPHVLKLIRNWKGKTVHGSINDKEK